MSFLLCKPVCVAAGFVYPGYASYKAIRANDHEQTEKLLMLWVVIGALSAYEGTLEWLVNWLPFYYPAKTLLLLWLTLPQIQGSTWVYLTYVHPFLAKHEPEIDAAIVDAKSRARQAGLEYINRAWIAIKELLVGAAAAQQAPEQAQPPPNAVDAYPKQAIWSVANGLVRQYAPSAIAAGQALFRPMNTRGPTVNLHAASPPRARTPSDDSRSIGMGRPPMAPLPGGSDITNYPKGRSTSASAAYNSTKEELRQRRQRLEAELAEIEAMRTSSSPRQPSREPSPLSSHSSSRSLLDEQGLPRDTRRVTSPMAQPESSSQSHRSLPTKLAQAAAVGQKLMDGSYVLVQPGQAGAPHHSSPLPGQSPGQHGQWWPFGSPRPASAQSEHSQDASRKSQ